MGSARMHSRVPAARVRGVGCVAGYRLAFDKPGADGTARANLATDPGGLVWGVLWSFPESEWPSLDRAEPGYARRDVEVVCEGSRARAQTYVATHPANAPLEVSEPYGRLVLDAAREHALPAEHLARIASLVAGRR